MCLACSGTGLDPTSNLPLSELAGDVLDLDAAIGHRDPKPDNRQRLPRLVPGTTIETCTMEELLLMAIAGERGDESHDDPLEAIARRLANEIEAISATTRLEADVTGDLLHHAAGRARVLAEMIRRAHA